MSVENSEIILALMVEHMNELRHVEEHRQWIINLIIIVVSGATAIGGSIGFSTASIPISILVIALGLFGIFATLKLYERQLWYQNRLKLLVEQLDDFQEGLELDQLYKHEVNHKKRHGSLSWDESIRIKFSSVRMHMLWVIFNLLVCLLGIFMLLISTL
ncbi:hypothetical protein [Leptolyngbya sp. KIOST-1]|uniref:hypothetical protein n=1 Tax=Leptolyngbya sp. KIOST-1 TaxID=1229172 RepID=UPI00056B32B9|nr:hypothetical protein [Leptolyngbya sp. KIOST-1]